RGLEREGAIKLALVVNLDQSIEVPFLCRFEQAAGLGIVHTRENHEYAIRPQGSCLDYLIRIEHEILAQHGQRGCSSRDVEMLRRALKGRRIRQNGEACGTASLICRGD